MIIKKFTRAVLPSVIALTLVGCGVDGVPTPVVTGPVVEPTPAPVAVGQQVTLETAIEHITIDGVTQYYIDLEQDAETLVISFAKGVAGESLGDPDMYVKFEDDSATLDNYICASLRSPGSNETCIINKPQAGRYQIVIDPYLPSGETDNTVADATLWASTTLLPANRACNDGLVIRGQAMSENDLDNACNTINQTQTKFHQVFANLSPAQQEAVPGDLNETTDLTIFASLSNHTIWMDYLNDSSNTSGIYYETAPSEDYHSSEIYTFNALEWTSGLTAFRSLSHEYIHALDGRFNKAGGYIAATAWWSEGLAEYVSYESPYDRFETSLAEEKPSLSDIFQTHNNGYATSPYTWGALAVAFFAQQKPQELTQMLSLMREGQWDEWDGLMVSWAEIHQAEFTQWLSTGPREDFESSAKSLTLGSFELVEGRGGWLYQVEVPEGTDSLTINMTGGSANSGSMDLDLMVSAGQVPHWSFGAAPQCAPYKEGNEETCTFTDITPGTYYITLDEYHSWAADIVDVYLSACTGTDCLVDLPEPKPLVEFVDVVLPVDPLPPAEAEVLAISSCDLVTPYTRSSDAAIVSITNTTDTPVSLYWISNDTGQPYLDSAYATLAQGEEYTADYWVIGDRMMLADSSNACLGVANLSTSNNKFVIDDAVVSGG